MSVSLRKGVRYVPGNSFRCWARPLTPNTVGDLLPGPECGAEIVMHGYFWCHQVCPECLTCYLPTAGQVMQMTGGYFPASVVPTVLENIRSNGGQYVPFE